MKTIIKLLIVIAIINAAVRGGLATAKYYQLKDQSQQLVTFGGNASTGELQNRILEQATALQLPVESGDVLVTRDGLKTTAEAAYTQPVEVFPRYTYPINFHFTVEGINMGQGVNPGGHPLANR